jgi:hypothetical protein
MADLGEAFNITFVSKKSFQNLDYFFTQRTLNEDQEYFDKNMNRKNKKVKVTHNFLTINIPTILSTADNNQNKPLSFDIEIFGDEGYHYKGTIMSYEGIIPNFTIPIQSDKKLFININYNFKTNNEYNNEKNYKKFINFIEVPKRYQNIDSKNIEDYENNTEISNH